MNNGAPSFSTPQMFYIYFPILFCDICDVYVTTCVYSYTIDLDGNSIPFLFINLISITLLYQKQTLSAAQPFLVYMVQRYKQFSLNKQKILITLVRGWGIYS